MEGLVQAKTQAYAKINLSLDVLGRRPDGYHLLNMVMQSVSLADTLTLSPREGEEILVQTNLSFLPTGSQNLAAKAARHYWQSCDLPPQGLLIQIEKQIPVCAGLAGGSSDGAAVLRLLNQQRDQPLPLDQLQAIAQGVGSDVPYCVQGGTALAQGAGEILRPLPAIPPCVILLCKPGFSISTPQLFASIDKIRLRLRPDTQGLEEAIVAGDLQGMAQRLFNVFEQALTPRQQTVIQGIKSTLVDAGALGASMSGSGPTVLGVFAQEAQAQEAYDRLKPQYAETFLTHPV